MRVHARRHDTGILCPRNVYAWTTFLVACKIPWNMHGTSRAWHFTREKHGIIRTCTCKMPRNMRGISRVRDSTQMGHGVIATCVI